LFYTTTDLLEGQTATDFECGLNRQPHEAASPGSRWHWAPTSPSGGRFSQRMRGCRNFILGK
jgi:hypothetical protein